MARIPTSEARSTAQLWMWQQLEVGFGIERSCCWLNMKRWFHDKQSIIHLSYHSDCSVQTDLFSQKRSSNVQFPMLKFIIPQMCCPILASLRGKKWPRDDDDDDRTTVGKTGQVKLSGVASRRVQPASHDNFHRNLSASQSKCSLQRAIDKVYEEVSSGSES